MVATTTTPVTLEERLRVAGSSLSRELLEELRARGPEGIALLEAEIECSGKKVYYAGLLKLAIAWLKGDFKEIQDAQKAEWTDELMRSLLRDPLALFQPRRIVAYEVLDEAAQASLFTPEFRQRFLAAADRLAGPDAYSDDLEEPFERDVPKVGRNDPCPCGSGKKFKKCCESKASKETSRRSIGELVREARYEYTFYTLDFEEQLRLVGADAFRAHLEILANPTRVRSFLSGEPYLVLSALSREADPWNPGPRWTRDAALELIEGPGHVAADRGELASWLLVTREDEATTLAPRIVAGLSRGEPLSVQSIVNVAMPLSDVDPALVLELLKAPTIPKDDPRIAILRALAARDLDDDLLVLEQLEIARDALAGNTSRRDLYVAVWEALTALDDVPVDMDALLESGAVSRATVPPTIPASVAGVADEASIPLRERTLPYLDEGLPDRVNNELAASEERAQELGARAGQARADDQAAQSDVLALERQLADARRRAAKTQRARSQAERALEDARRGGPAAAVEVALRALRDAEDLLSARLGEVGPHEQEVAAPVLVAIGANRSVLVLPLPPETARAEGESALVHVAFASAAALAEATGQDTSAPRIRPGQVLGRLALGVEGQGVDPELLAAALDSAWSKVQDLGRARVLPQVAQIVGEVGEALVTRVTEVAVPAPETTSAREITGDLPLVVAAQVLGRSPFALALEIGAAGLWSGARVPAGTLEVLTRPGPQSAAQLVAAEPHGEDGPNEDDLDGDPHPGRRTLRVILRRLLRFGKIGAAHTRIDNTLRGAAPHLRGLMKDVMLTLLTLGVLRRKPTQNGLHVSIEPERVPEVQRLIATGEVPWGRVREILGA